MSKVGEKSAFRDFIESNFYDKICKSIDVYYARHKDFINDKFDVCGAHDFCTDSFEIKTVKIEDKGNHKIEFDVVIVSNTEYQYYRIYKRSRDYDRDIIDNVWLTITFKADIRNLKNAYIFSVDEYSKIGTPRSLDEYMVPIMERSEYSKRANEILEKYYGNDYDYKDFNIKDLAKRMGLNVKPLHNNFIFSKDKPIFGQCFFEDTEASFYDRKNNKDVVMNVPGNTILYDPKCLSIYSMGSPDITIAHECVHYELHKNFYFFMKLITESKKTYISCENSGKIEGIITGKDDLYLEPQANGIAPFLAMPEKKFKKEADELIERYEKDGLKPIEYMDLIISKLRDDFHTTLYSVRKRLLDMGKLSGLNIL